MVREVLENGLDERTKPIPGSNACGHFSNDFLDRPKFSITSVLLSPKPVDGETIRKVRQFLEYQGWKEQN